MIIINLNKTLKDRSKTIYALAKETGLTPNNLGKLAKNETKSISFDMLNKICINLNCNITDIIEFIPE